MKVQNVMLLLKTNRALGFQLERPKSVITDLVKLWLDGKDNIWGE